MNMNSCFRRFQSIRSPIYRPHSKLLWKWSLSLQSILIVAVEERVILSGHGMILHAQQIRMCENCQLVDSDQVVFTTFSPLAYVVG